jgi:acyl dehydratase
MPDGSARNAGSIHARRAASEKLPPVPVRTDAIGKRYAPFNYAVGREKIREYALAVGEQNPLHHDLEAARAVGYADLVAPPMFAVVYCRAALATALFDPELGIEFARLVHGSQEFRWGELVVAGDEITTRLSVIDVAERAGLGFYVFRSVSENDRGEPVCEGTWTNIVRTA